VSKPAGRKADIHPTLALTAMIEHQMNYNCSLAAAGRRKSMRRTV
jgi:hypothetical protein